MKDDETHKRMRIIKHLNSREKVMLRLGRGCGFTVSKLRNGDSSRHPRETPKRQCCAMDDGKDDNLLDVVIEDCLHAEEYQESWTDNLRGLLSPDERSIPLQKDCLAF
jgi:hypothetical protein